MYSARITRLNPTAFIFLIDRSGSMEEKMTFGQSMMTKAEAVAMVTNMLIRELINRCRREEGILDYFDIAAIGYSADEATMLLGGPEGFVKPSELAMRPCKKRSFTRERVLPDGRAVITNDELKYWIEPKAEGSTPMRSALEQALLLAGRWCRKPGNSASYPPTIFNITDGEASDGDYEILTGLAGQIKALHTDDGNALLININLSTGTDGETVIFPASADELPATKHTQVLYDMSSPMPAEYTEAILQLRGDGAYAPFRGMSHNTSVPGLISMLNVGSRSINKMQ